MDNYNIHFTQFTSPKLSEFIKIYIPDTKGLYKMKKPEKVNIMSDFLRNEKTLNLNDFIYVKPERSMREYGISRGVVKSYTDNEQLNLNQYYDNLNPLAQKTLDEKKHKTQYKRNIIINLQEHQQKFIISYINDYLQGALLFHSVGSGKTLTSVVFSHYYLMLKPDHNVCIISPPSLLFNFVEAMKEYGLDIRDNRYKFETYIKFCKNPDNYVNEKTLLIIDEAHYFRTFIVEGKGQVTNLETGKTHIDNGKNRNGQIIIDACAKCHKIIAMTGTPFINKLYDVENIMSMIGKKQPITPEAFNTVISNNDNLKDYFDYRISYFNVMDTDAKKYFPDVIYKYIPIVIEDEKYQNIYARVAKGNVQQLELDNNVEYDKMINNLIKQIKPQNDNDEDIDVMDMRRSEESLTAYYNASRQLSNFIVYQKIKYIIDLIKKNKGQNVIIYSVFMNSCLLLIKRELLNEKIKFVSIDGDITTKLRQSNLDKFNDISNDTNVLLISKAGTEGVSTRRTRHIVICESAFNMALTEQAVARAVRFKSHDELKEKDRNVTVHRLMIVVNEDDKEIVENFNNGSYNKKFMDYRIISMENENYKLKMIKRAAKLFMGEPEQLLLIPRYQKEEMKVQQDAWKKKGHQYGKKKEPFNFSLAQLNDRLFYYIMKDPYKIKLDRDTLFQKNLIKYNENNKIIEEKYSKEEQVIYISSSSDIKLELMSLKKKADIDTFIDETLKKGVVNKIEDYKDETTDLIIKSLNSGKNPNEIIKEQQKILIERKKTVLKLSNKIDTLMTMYQTDEFNKKVFNQSEKERRQQTSAALQEYHTPQNIADQLISFSTQIKEEKENMRILEPTAGYGSLVAAVVRRKKQIDYVIEMVEYNDDSRIALEAYEKTMKNNLSLQDTKNFLLYETNESYDLIIMNPPFHLRKSDTKFDRDYYDVDFVKRALTMMKDTGELLCIVSPAMYKKLNVNINNKFKIENNYFEIVLIGSSKKDKNTKGKNWKVGDEGGKGGNINVNYEMFRITRYLTS